MLRLFKNKHLGVVFYLQAFLLLNLPGCNVAKAQANDTTRLQEVEITTTRLNSSSIGKKIQTLDSLTLELFKNQTLDALLSNNTPVFVKSYGLGALQTTSFRGGNASQTAILWNGLNIQNNMLGLTDLSNVSTSLFNSVELEYGGSSALWGSGAMGGAVHLNNTHRLEQGFYTRLNSMFSNINSRSASTNLGYSNSKLSAVVKAFVVKSDNNYNYYSKYDGSFKTETKAYFDQLSLMPELKYFINSKNSIQSGAWITQGKRSSPNYGSNISNKIEQQDQSERMYGSWNYKHSKLSNVMKAAYFYERLDYLDSLRKIDSKARTETRLFENDLYWKWKAEHVANLGLNYTKNEGRITDYNGTKFIEKYAVFLSQKDEFLNKKLLINTVIRIEHTSINLNPITYNLGANYFINKHITLKLNGGKVYRIPTLNDRFWIPGGNPDIKPEEGYTIDGTAVYDCAKNNYELNISGSAFYKLITNWIQWVPYGVSGTHPINLQEVFSRGSETTWHLAHVTRNFRVQIKCLTSYALSTITKTELQTDDALGKQLIYSPRYLVNSSLLISYKTFAVSYFHNYVGYRFTASDNSAWIKPFHSTTARLTYLHSLREIEFGFFGNINNFLNKIYEVYDGRPQPQRYFEFGVQLNYKKNKNKTYEKNH